MILVLRPISRAAALGAALLIASPIAAAPESGPLGQWNRVDGLGGVRIARCGAALCGHVVWLKDANGPAYIGQRVLYDMHETSTGTWTGSAVNPMDGRTYAGTMTVQGAHLITRGCAMAGMICQTVLLSRKR